MFKALYAASVDIVSQMSGVLLAPSDILKVLLVSRKGTKATFPLLDAWNNCKVDLLKARESLKVQSGTGFWGKVLASKVSSFWVLLPATTYFNG